MRLDRFLTYRLHRLDKLSERASAQAYLQECGIPLSEGRCLAVIGAFAPLSVNDLAACTHLNKGQASRAAQALVERGLVRKSLSKTDGRGVLLAVTAKGRPVYRKAMQMIERRNHEIFAVLSASERALLGELLDRAAQHIADASQASDGD